MQVTSEQRIVDNTRQQLRLVEDFGIPRLVGDVITPVFQVNDDLAERVINVATAERTTAGTTALFTAPADPQGTWISALTLNFSVGQGGAA